MRLPQDDDEAVALIRHAIDSGMRYIDTCRCYGESEIKLGKALKDGYREKVILSTKWSPWIHKFDDSDDASADCVRKRMDESFKRLDVDYLDYYQVWNITNPEAYEMATRKGGMVDGIRQAVDEGMVGHLGFTSHDTPENLVRYFEETDWAEIVLLTYNILNDAYEPALEAAHKKGIGTIVMNPVGGGKLAEESPVLKELAREVGATSAAEMSIRYVLSNPNVDTIISGITRQSDVDSSIAASEQKPFTPEQIAIIKNRVKELAPANVGFCTGCRYCMPCPENVNIPAVMAAVYDERYWGLREAAKRHYASLKAANADSCKKCGACEAVCTQGLKIMKEMDYARENLGTE